MKLIKKQEKKMKILRRSVIVALILFGVASSAGCAPAHASGTSFPDFGSMLNLTGTAILANTGAYTAGTTFQAGGATRLSMWANVTLAGGTNLTSGVNVQFTCGYSASSDATIPTTWSNQTVPTLNQTQALTGTAGATTWQLLQSGAVTGAKAGCALQARSANASAGIAGDSIQIYVYGY